jgi:UDPglucose 6-dehydrogenase
MQICIVGTGYVGLVTAACFAETGNTVCCVDINPRVVETLREGRIHIHEPGLEELVSRNTAEGRLSFTTDLSEGMDKALFVFLCVGTPSLPDGSCNLEYVRQVASEVGKRMTDYKIVVNKSTVPVGTAELVSGLIAEELKNRGLDIEYDVVSNPEFLKEGDAVNDFMKPDRVVVGTDEVRTAKLLEALYSPFARSRDKLIVMSVKSAEMTKYAANCMLATKISFINEIANLCEAVGADVREVRQGIGSDSRIGYHFIYPGVGFGGSCFPKDVRSLVHTARECGVDPELIGAVEAVNNKQKQVLSKKILERFRDQEGVGGKTLALWGLAFKANTDDIREAPSLELIEALTAQGMKIRAYDPVAGANAAKALSGNQLVTIVSKQYEAVEGADCLAVVTEWNQFRNPDFPRIKETLGQPLIFDGRNLYSPSLLDSMGIEYHCIGRKTSASAEKKLIGKIQ